MNSDLCISGFSHGDPCRAEEYAPLNAGRRSISTFSVTWNLLLRCFLGGFPTIGIVSLGAWRKRLFKVAVERGGVAGSPG